MMAKKILLLLILSSTVLGVNYILKAFTEMRNGDFQNGFLFLAKGLLFSLSKLDNYSYTQAKYYILPCYNNYTSTYCVKNNIDQGNVKGRFYGYSISIMLEILIMLTFISLTLDIVKHLGVGITRYLLYIMFISLWILIFAITTNNFQGLSTLPDVIQKMNGGRVYNVSVNGSLIRF